MLGNVKAMIPPLSVYGLRFDGISRLRCGYNAAYSSFETKVSHMKVGDVSGETRGNA